MQVPWLSNAFLANMLYLFRLLGSPVSSLSYPLWNINVTGRCAMLVDMSVGYRELPSNERGYYSSIRDSFTVLVNINQYQMKSIASKKDCERVLRIMLFSTSLRLINTNETVSDVRHRLAQDLRNSRKRGVVPNFIAIGWFLFAMVLSIQSAFGQLGENAIAHDLALGLLLAFLPNNVLTSLIDRNPAAADDVRDKLNDFLNLVCDSLANDEIREDYIAEFGHWPEADTLGHLVNRAAQLVPHIRGDFFEKFAGQGRVRWHYGAAHPIVCDIEHSYIADNGRSWLHNEEEARMNLVLGRVENGLLWFDNRGLWQILVAIIHINGSILGPFLLSYFTPTVGLGCRSGNYMVYAIISDALFALEMLTWFLLSPASQSTKQWLKQSFVGAYRFVVQPDSRVDSSLKWTGRMLQTAWSTSIATVGIVFIWAATAIRYPFAFYRNGDNWNEVQNDVLKSLDSVERISRRDWLNVGFSCVEFLNAALLSKIIVSQTFGLFRDCACQSSIWSSIGGYIDLTQWKFTDNPDVMFYWTLGTTITLTLMGLMMWYCILEYCIQAHLSTSNYAASLRGLRRTRRFRYVVAFLRYPWTVLVLAINNCLAPNRRKSTIWTAHIVARREPFVPGTLGTEMELEQFPDSPEGTSPLMRLPSTVPSVVSDHSLVNSTDGMVVSPENSY